MKKALIVEHEDQTRWESTQRRLLHLNELSGAFPARQFFMELAVDWSIMLPSAHCLANDILGGFNFVTTVSATWVLMKVEVQSFVINMDVSDQTWSRLPLCATSLTSLIFQADEVAGIQIHSHSWRTLKLEIGILAFKQEAVPTTSLAATVKKRFEPGGVQPCLCLSLLNIFVLLMHIWS